MSDLVKYLTIHNDDASVKFSMLYNDEGKLWANTQSLTFCSEYPENKEYDYWDNPKFILRLLEAIERRNKTTETEELEKICKENNLSFVEVKETLYDIYVESKKMGCWDKKLVTIKEV